MRFITLLALAGFGSIATAAEPAPTIAQLHIDPIAGFQGEWVSRFCSKNFRWVVEGRSVKMHKRDANKPATDYDNRYPEGATIMVLGEEFDRNDRGIRFRTTSVQPDGRQGSPGQGTMAAMTLYWSDPDTKKQPYYSFNEMLRLADKARQCS